LGAEAVAASTPYVLVDLSDTTNYPHDTSDELHLLMVHVSVEQQSDGAFDLWVGVVTENDATDGSVDWLHAFHAETVSNPTDSTGHVAETLDFTAGGANPDGVNLRIESGAPVGFLTNETQANSANWQNDVGRTSPAGAGAGTTGKPGVGDLVLWVEEVADGGTLDFSVTVLYEAA
jgi:hypothetical protein